MTSIDARIATALRTANRLVIFTGAGVSAESGIPTFRDKQTGLWERYDATELATPDAFDRDPALVWGWYEWRRAKVLSAQPNPAHHAIAAMASRIPLTLITQNVDDLHERAGSKYVIHLHGQLAHPYCEKCRTPYTYPPGTPKVSPDGDRIDPPRCPSCGARVRPGVVWFREPLPTIAWTQARDAASHSDFFICCGTSSVVQPAASLTAMAANAGATTLQINPNPTDIDGDVTFSIRGPAGIVLPHLVADAWGTPR